MKKIIILSLAFILSSCCNKDEEFTEKLTDYNGKQLRIDGFYTLGCENCDILPVYFLYKNGIMMEYGAIKKGLNINEDDNYFEKRKSLKHYYSIFKIDENIIKVQERDKTLRGCLMKFDRKGRILNDTTFFLYRDDKTKDTYNFVKYKNKPSSENDFIK